MDEDSKGLLKYFSILTFTILFNFSISAVSKFLFKMAETYDSSIAFHILICLVMIGLFMGFLIPLIITIKAICDKWSKYLDWFFNKLIIPTIFFLGILAMICLVYSVDVSDIRLVYKIASVILLSLCWTYFSIYIVIVVNNIIRLFKNLYRKYLNPNNRAKIIKIVKEYCKYKKQ